MLKKSFFSVLMTVLLVLGLVGLGYAGFSFEIPTGTIDVDGGVEDWSGIEPIMEDIEWDSCGEGTDLRSVFIAKDDTYLYWRIDTWSETFEFEFEAEDGNKYKRGPGIVFYSISEGLIVYGLSAEMIGGPPGGVSKCYSPGVWQYIGPQDQGVIREVAEGRIPLSLFDNSYDINHLLAWYHYDGETNTVCDSVNRDFPEPAPPLEYHVGFFVQHRVYEDGREFNRLWFELRDESNNQILENIVNYVELLDPNDQPVNISDVQFSNTRMSFPYYDSENGKWVYNFDENGQLFFDWSAYFAIIEDSLIEGKYNLTVTDNQDNQYTSQFTFNGQVDLPIIKKKKFKKKYDDGNLILKWSVPYDLNSTWSTSVRAHINIYKEGEYTGVLFTKVPTHLGRLFVPSKVIEKLLAEGDEFYLQIHLRTNDNNNRTYSKEKKIKLKLKK